MSRFTMILFTILLMATGGCFEGDLNIIISFDKIMGLEKDSQVIFEQNDIGTVKSIHYSTDGHYEVTAVIKKEFAGAVTDQSSFFITDDPREGGRKVIEMVVIQEGGNLLKKGARVEGTTQTNVYFDQLKENFEKGFDRMVNQFEEFSRDLKPDTESPQYRELERELKQLVEEMKRSGKSAQKKIEEDILPKLQEEIEKLRKQLEEYMQQEPQSPQEAPAATEKI